MRLSSVALLALVPTLAFAQSNVSVSGDSAIAGRGAFFALSVADLKASTQWYTEKLGLKVVMQPPKANDASVVVLEGLGLIVELIQHDKAANSAVSEPVLVHGIIKAGVIVENWDRTLALLRARRAPIAFGPFPAGRGQRANLIIRDNSGNLIQFFGRD